MEKYPTPPRRKNQSVPSNTTQLVEGYPTYHDRRTFQALGPSPTPQRQASELACWGKLPATW